MPEVKPPEWFKEAMTKAIKEDHRNSHKQAWDAGYQCGQVSLDKWISGSILVSLTLGIIIGYFLRG